MPLNILLSWDRAKGIAMALEHGYPMKPFSMQEILNRDGISNAACKPRNPETYLMGLCLSIVATLPWLYCHDALFPLERLNASKDIFD
ncbi:unnamed protein product [Penicillium camemberti]|uniref:Str. FM013 n=1 Tax=Penicillium camemberti (strain FM 013) TaxID=1429867 RepID=A0A0G4NW82_PENC3|nr:unnamed protein product [Penicillium camemberti]